MNRIVKRTSESARGPESKMPEARGLTEDAKGSVDELLSQLENERVINEVDDSPPIEITDEVRAKMMTIMDRYLQYQEKLRRLNTLKREINGQIGDSSRELMTLMKLYGLNELIRNDKKFVYEEKSRRKALKKDEFKTILESVIADKEIIDRIYQQAEEQAEAAGQVVEKVKCLKYRPKGEKKS